MAVSGNLRAANWERWRPAVWILFGVLLLFPAIVMVFTDEVRWTGTDFIAAAAIFTTVGGAIELIVRFVDQSALRMANLCGVTSAALAIWADGAVGLI